MKKSWIIGLVLFTSIATNITLGAIVVGKKIKQDRQQLRMLEKHFSGIPEVHKIKAIEALRDKRPIIREKMKELHKERKEIFKYIKSDEYNRAEAEKRLESLRLKTADLQKTAQTMLLDIGDSLPAEERAKLFKRKFKKMEDRKWNKNKRFNHDKNQSNE